MARDEKLNEEGAMNNNLQSSTYRKSKVSEQKVQGNEKRRKIK
jgi:hypothetical protein